MKVNICRAIEYSKDDVPVESYDLRVESDHMADGPSRIVDTYLELRDKLNKAIKEDK